MRLLAHVFGDLGLPMVGLVVVNSVRRRNASKRESRRRATIGPGVAPGSIERVDPVPGGARFSFSRAELEVVFVAPDILRVCWGPGPLPVPYALDEARAGPGRSDRPSPSVLVADHPGRGWEVLSDLLALRVAGDGATELTTRDGRLLRSAAPPARVGGGWAQSFEMRPGERFAGLGEQAAGVDLRGGRFRVWNTDAGGAWGPGSGPLYIGIPVFVATHHDGDLLTFYENSTRSVFSFAGSAGSAGSASGDEGATASVSFAGGQLRQYTIAGSPPHLLDRYSELTGRPFLPPRWALGYHQSRWGYRSARDVRDVLEGYRRMGLPLSALHLDIDYMDGYRVFTVDPGRFGDLSALASEAAGSGVRLVTILDPGVKVDSAWRIYREGRTSGLFCTDRRGEPVEGVVWPGRAVFPDFTDPRAREWWASQYGFLTDAGVGGVWHDMNEPASIALMGDPTLPLDTRHDFDGRGGDHAEGHNLYGLLMNRSGFEGLSRARPDRRPFVVSRSGWAGNQRWAWNWTGDAASTYAAMRQQVATLVGLGLSGVAFSGSDTGGFSGVPDDELYLRWLQMSVFTGFCRTHSVVGAPPREPWRFGHPTREIVAAWIRFRYRLLPYLYTLAHEASVTGAPLVRPLWWREATSDVTQVAGGAAAPAASDQQDDTFLLGDALLVAPVCEPAARSRRLVPPAGTWTSLWTHGGGTSITGGDAVQLDTAADRLPVLVRAGTILPLDDGFAEGGGPCAIEGDRAAATDRAVVTEPAGAGDSGDGLAPRMLAFHCWPSPEGTAEGVCTDDAGDGSGPVRRDELSFERSAARAVLRWRRSGDFPPPARVRVVLHGLEAAGVAADGEDVTTFDRGVIECGPFDLLEVQVR